MATYGSFKKISADGFLANSITTDDIASSTITATELGADSVDSGKIIDGSVSNTKISNNAVGTSELASTLNISSNTVSYRPILNADVSAGAAIATSKVTGNIVVTTGNSALAGATQFFSPGFFGVDKAYTFTNGTRVRTLRHRRLNVGRYYFWILIVTKSGNDYTVRYGALVETPTGGTVGEVLTFDLDQSKRQVGDPTIPSSGTYYLGWKSGGDGYTSPTGSIYADGGSGVGTTIDYVANTTAPTAGAVYTVTTTNTGGGINFEIKSTRTAFETSVTAGHPDGSFPSGGQWFSPGFFGVEPTATYAIPGGSKLQTVTYRRVNTGSYSWWFLIVSKSGTTYTPIYGCRITTPAGGTNGETLTQDVNNVNDDAFGVPYIPSTGTYYIAWISSAPGYTAPSGSIYNDTGGSSGGSVEYVSTNVAPYDSTLDKITSYTTTSGATGNRMHIKVTATRQLAPSALLDITNASNINGGRLPFAQGGMGTDAGFKMQKSAHNTGSGRNLQNWGTNSIQSGARDFRNNESANTYAWTSDSRVTVYQAGTYVCLVELIPYSSTGQIDLFIYKNGSAITDFRGGTDIGNHAAVSGRVILNLSANDYIEMYSEANDGTHNGFYSSWSFTKLGGWA